MRKICAYLLCFFLACGVILYVNDVAAQTTVQIGTGVEAPGTSSLYAPIWRLSASTTNDFSRSNVLYTSTELATVGILAGSTITKIAFYKIGAGASVAGFSHKIYMRNSASSPPLSTATTWANILSTHTVVYNSSSYTVSATAGWVEVVLNTPFVYNGQSLEIAFDSDFSAISGNPTTDKFDWQFTSGFSDYVIGQVSTSAPASLNGTVVNYKQRPNIQITYFSAAACTSPPTPGTATANPSTANCPGTAVTLNVAGNSFGTGQTYIWQSSSSVGGPYTDFTSSSSTQSIVVNPTASTYYRLAVTCSGNTQYSTPVLVIITQPLNGAYTINPALPASASNFQSFAAVISALSCPGGIAGPVTFDVAPGSGPYNEQIILNPVAGASSTNTITFNGNGATISYLSSNTNERGIIKLNGADYVKFDNFSIVGQGTTTSQYGYGIHLLNNADNNTISNCTINVIATSSSTNYCGIVVNSSATTANTNGDANCDNNTFTGNTITGGYYGIILVADGPTYYINNNSVVNNTVQEFYNYGIYVNGNNNTLIEGNDIKRPTRGTSITVFYGIYFDGGNTNCKVSKNKIHSTFDGSLASTSTSVGINFVSADATTGNENIVSNNIIYHFTGTGLHYAIQNNGSDYVKYYHNSIALENETTASGTSATRGFYQVSNAATGIEFKNNIIRISREGTGDKVGIALAIAASNVVSNNNNVYVSSSSQAYFGYTTVPYTTLADWKTGTGQDGASKSVDPGYFDATNGNLLPSANILNDIGAPVGITTDITGGVRNAANPDPGAYEFNAGPCTSLPTPGNAVISSAASAICAGSAVALDLENNSIGTGQTYTWQSSPTSGSGFTTFSSPSGSSAITVNPAGNLYYRAAVTCGTQTRFSSEVLVTVSPALTGGTYTINPGLPAGGTNFQNFNSAILAISCGVTSSTIFNVAPGLYSEQVILPAIPGMSSTNNIRFNGNGAILDYTSSNTGERATLKLNGTDYITFDNFVINANGSSTTEYGYAVQILGDADNNTISNCTINATQASTSGNFAGIVVSGSATSATSTSSADGNVINNNTITGGLYGITVIGNISAFTQNNVVTNNVIREFYTYGIYVTGTNNTLVEKNDISRPNRSTVGSFYGIYFSGVGQNAKISKNRIHDPFTGNINLTTGSFGIYFTSANAAAGNENIISNNLFYDFRSTGPISALYLSSGSYAKFYHNTISFDDLSSTTTGSYSTNGFLMLSDEAGIEFKNNIITITRADASLKRGLSLPTTVTSLLSDNNVIYVSAATGTNSTVYMGSTSYTTLAQWQASNGNAYDQHSKSLDPLFVSPGSANFTPAESLINNMGANVGIPTDILDVARIVSSPDPGAYEFANTPCSGTPTGGNATVNPFTPVCAGTQVLLSATGHSIGGGITYQWQSSSTLNGTYTSVSGVLNYPDFNVNAPATTTFYRLAVTCAGNTVNSAPVELVVKQPLNGTYTINQGALTNIITGGTNFQTFADAVNFLNCGIAGPVVFNVSPATYNEQVIINAISGTSATNTVTFNGNGATVTYLSANTNERGIIKLNGADFININNFIIEAQGTTSVQYGYGVQLLNDADNNTISNCIINVTSTPATASSTSYAGIVVNSSAAGTPIASGSSLCDNNTFIGNTITGGHTGIALTANSSTSVVNYNKVLNNTINDFYTNGIYLNGNNNALIEGNNISRNTRASVTTFQGINLENGSTNCRVSKNKMHDPFGAAPASTLAAYGVRLSNVDAATGNENIISNNFIYSFNGGTGTQNGILNNSSDNNKFYFNSILLDDASASAGDTRGIYVQTTTVTGFDFRNNIIVLARGGTGAKQAIYFEPTSVSSYTISNNNYYISASSGLLEIAHMGATGYITLADWQTASGKDANSLTADPQFVSPADLHLQSTSPLKNAGIEITEVYTDIDDNIRNTTPVIGADEFGALSAGVYVFTGSGNFNNPANWSNGTVPPSTLPAGGRIYINPSSGISVLNVPLTISSGGRLIVLPNKNFIIQGNLILQ